MSPALAQNPGKNQGHNGKVRRCDVMNSTKHKSQTSCCQRMSKGVIPTCQWPIIQFQIYVLVFPSDLYVLFWFLFPEISNSVVIPSLFPLSPTAMKWLEISPCTSSIAENIGKRTLWQDVIALKLQCTSLMLILGTNGQCHWNKGKSAWEFPEIVVSHALQKPSYIIICPQSTSPSRSWPHTRMPLLLHWATSVPLQAGSPTVLCGLSQS